MMSTRTCRLRGFRAVPQGARIVRTRMGDVTVCRDFLRVDHAGTTLIFVSFSSRSKTHTQRQRKTRLLEAVSDPRRCIHRSPPGAALRNRLQHVQACVCTRTAVPRDSDPPIHHPAQSASAHHKRGHESGWDGARPGRAPRVPPWQDAPLCRQGLDPRSWRLR